MKRNLILERRMHFALAQYKAMYFHF